MSKDPDVDPRFPAVFQRGYAGGGEPRATRQGDAGLPGVSEAIVSPPVPEEGVTSASVDQAEGSMEPGQNPFLVTLWVLSIALLSAGAWAGLWSQQLMFGNVVGTNTAEHYAIAQSIIFLSEPALHVGAMGIIGLLFWHAAAWRRRAIAAQRHPQN